MLVYKASSITSYHDCLEKTIEKAEEEANVIFTGTIKDLYEDVQHPDMMKAKVEVKRVMKGNNVIKQLPEEVFYRKKTVTIDGLGDPHICHSYARKYDTRIFLANKGANGELKLNSSLVRLTLNNIIRTDAAVQGIMSIVIMLKNYDNNILLYFSVVVCESYYKVPVINFKILNN